MPAPERPSQCHSVLARRPSSSHGANLPRHARHPSAPAPPRPHDAPSPRSEAPGPTDTSSDLSTRIGRGVRHPHPRSVGLVELGEGWRQDSDGESKEAGREGKPTAFGRRGRKRRRRRRWCGWGGGSSVGVRLASPPAAARWPSSSYTAATRPRYSPKDHPGQKKKSTEATRRVAW